MARPIELHHPEIAVGGYTAIDGTVEFYLRLRTLLRPNQTVLDLGAGRAAWFGDLSIPSTTRSLLDLRGDGRILYGCDIDPVVRTNPLLNEASVLASSDSRLPYEDNSMDIVVSDWTFEHLADPAVTASEVGRVLRPGGWLCVRTPNKNGYISVANRAVPERLHTCILKKIQPHRQEQDVFPTHYRANTAGAVRDAFGSRFDLTMYTQNPEPAYFGESRTGWYGMKLIERLLPRRFGAVLIVFGRRRSGNAGAA